MKAKLNKEVFNLIDRIWWVNYSMILNQLEESLKAL